MILINCSCGALPVLRCYSSAINVSIPRLPYLKMGDTREEEGSGQGGGGGGGGGWRLGRQGGGGELLS